MINVAQKMSWFLAAGLVIATVGCTGMSSDAPEPVKAQESLTLERTDGNLVGVFVSGDAQLTFVSRAPSADRLELSMDIDGKAFEWSMDNERNLQSSNGFGAELGEADKELLKAFGDALLAKLTEEGWGERYDEFPGVAAAFWADAPCGYVHNARTFFIRDPRPHSLGDDNADYAAHVCVMQGETLDAMFDEGDGGTAHTVSVVVGSDWGTNECGDNDYSCMGRCGADCSGFGGGWTLDCLEHDVCGHELCASGGGSDANCGDEYDEAQNDFTSHMFGGRCDGTFSDAGGDTDTGSDPDTDTGSGGGTVIALDETNLSASSGTSIHFQMVVPEGGTDVLIAMSGGSGDGDLYVRKGALPTTSTYDCRPYKSGNVESCSGSGAGTYYIMIRAYSTFSGVNLQGSYFGEAGDPVDPVCGNGVVESGEQCDGGACCASNCTFASSATVCRSSAGECDAAEYCSGSAPTCPSDLDELDGTSCSGGTCQAGVCEDSGGGAGSGTFTALSESSLSAGAGQNLFFDFVAPTGTTDVTITMSGGTGDADLHTKKNVQVSGSTYDCRPYQFGNEEVCNHTGAGTYYIMINAYEAFTGVSLTATYVIP